MANAYQAALAQAVGALDEDKLKKLGIAQLNSQMSNANSSVAQATAAAVKANQTATQAGIKGAAGVGATVAGAIPMASTPNLQVNPNTPEQKYLANYTTGATTEAANGVNPDTPPLTNQGGNEHYFAYGQPAAGFQSGMSAADQAAWNTIGQKYAAGDKSWLQDTNSFREDGNWGSYTDANGNINGWLYAANGTGGYAPVFGGKVGETGYATGTVFYGPDGSAYMLGNDGTLTKNGTVEWLKYGQSIGPQAGYHNNGGSFIGTDANGNLKYYDYDTVTDADLERMGYYRDNSGMINLINNDYYIAKGIQTGQITPEQATLAKAVKSAGNDQAKIAQAVEADKGNGSYTPLPSGYTPVEYTPVEYTPREIEAPTYTQRTSTAPTVPTASQAPESNTNYQLQYQAPQSSYDPTQQTPWQNYLAQWEYGEAPQWTGEQDETRKDIAGYDYGTAPEWEGSEYENEQAEILKNAQNMQWTGSAYDQRGDELLEKYLQEYGGSQYDPLRDKYLEQYGEAWQGSPYLQERDDALKKAQNMQWNYDPNTDPVWQALQKQYRREGDRATQQALGQAAARTSGVPSSYAVTAASQAGDYYAAQLSDWLPQLYQDAYNRYLQEFERQMGISDQYAGFDQTEYDRWHDQQGRNLELADAYNQLGKQDYGRYQDRMNQLAGGADAYYQRGQTDYNRFLDEYDRQLGMADRYGLLGERDYGRYQDRLGKFNTDREFRHGVNRETIDDAERADQTAYQRYLDSLDQYNKDKAMSYEQYRDAINDARYDDETAYNRAWNEENRAYTRAYQEYRDSILDNREDREWAQQLREYADQQNWKALDWQQYLREYEDKLSEQEREWAYQMYRDAVSDERYERQYADQRDDTMYNRARQEDETAYQRAMYAQEYADQRGGKEWEQNYKQTAYNDALEDAALDYLNTNGIVTGRYAEILGVPDGTTRDQYYSRYLGGGSTSPFEVAEIDVPAYKEGGSNPGYTPYPQVEPEPEGGMTLPELRSKYGNDLAMEVWNLGGQPWYSDLKALAGQDSAAALDEIYYRVEAGQISEGAIEPLLDMLGLNMSSVTYKPSYRVTTVKGNRNGGSKGNNIQDIDNVRGG